MGRLLEHYHRYRQKRAVLDTLAAETFGAHIEVKGKRYARREVLHYLLKDKEPEIKSGFPVRKRAREEYLSDKTREPSRWEKRRKRKALIAELVEIKKYIDPSPELLYSIALTYSIARTLRTVYGKRRDVPYEKWAELQVPRSNDFSRDWSYPVDWDAEEVVREAAIDARTSWMGYGFVTEEKMYRWMEHKEKCVIMVDPVDGSRMAQMGAENATITLVGLPGRIQDPKFKDIQFGITYAVKENEMYITKKVDGVVKVFVVANGKVHEVPPFQKDFKPELKHTRLAHEAYSLSSEISGIAIDPLHRAVEFKTENPSGSYGMLSLIRAQHYLYVDLRKRLLDEFGYIPNLTTDPKVKAAMPMDIAACWMMLKALGGEVTTVDGEELDDFSLWNFEKDSDGNLYWSPDCQLAIIAAATKDLHRDAKRKVDEGISNLRQRFPKRRIFRHMD